MTATVQFQGQILKVDPAWEVVAPPNYGPRQKSVRTMWDLMRDTAINDKRLKLPAPAQPSFTADIQPIFERLARILNSICCSNGRQELSMLIMSPAAHHIAILMKCHCATAGFLCGHTFNLLYGPSLLPNSRDKKRRALSSGLAQLLSMPRIGFSGRQARIVSGLNERVRLGIRPHSSTSHPATDVSEVIYFEK